MSERVLGTDRLVLRRWTLGDLATFHLLWSDPEVVWWGPSADEAASRVQLSLIDDENRASPPGLAWYAVEHAGRPGHAIGNVMLRPAPYAPGEIDVGWLLARAEWGKGLATEAVRSAVTHGFAIAKPARVVAVIVPGRERSIRVAERLGFTRAGAARHAGLDHDLYELTAVRFRDSTTRR